MRKAVVLAAVAIATLAATVWHGRPTFSFATAERVRLQAHFDSVERELRARDVPELSPAQRTARSRLMDILHSYQVRGVFPRNTDFPDRDMPVFIDWWGKRCGFAYLIEQTGNEDLCSGLPPRATTPASPSSRTTPRCAAGSRRMASRSPKRPGFSPPMGVATGPAAAAPPRPPRSRPPLPAPGPPPRLPSPPAACASRH